MKDSQSFAVSDCFPNIQAISKYDLRHTLPEERNIRSALDAPKTHRTGRLTCINHAIFFFARMPING